MSYWYTKSLIDFNKILSHSFFMLTYLLHKIFTLNYNIYYNQKLFGYATIIYVITSTSPSSEPVVFLQINYDISTFSICNILFVHIIIYQLCPNLLTVPLFELCQNCREKWKILHFQAHYSPSASSVTLWSLMILWSASYLAPARSSRHSYSLLPQLLLKYI